MGGRKYGAATTGFAPEASAGDGPVRWLRVARLAGAAPAPPAWRARTAWPPNPSRIVRDGTRSHRQARAGSCAPTEDEYAHRCLEQDEQADQQIVVGRDDGTPGLGHPGEPGGVHEDG